MGDRRDLKVIIDIGLILELCSTLRMNVYIHRIFELLFSSMVTILTNSSAHNHYLKLSTKKEFRQMVDCV